MVDVIVRNAERLPDEAYLSVRLGPVRRQCLFRPGSKFAFDADGPKTPLSQKAMSIDVFQKVGSAHVRFSDLISVGDGAWKGDVDVPLAVGGTARVSLEVDAAGGGGVEQAMRVGADTDTSAEARKDSVLKARSYLDKHMVQQLLGRMMRGLLSQQPADPVEFMKTFLQEEVFAKGRAPDVAPSNSCDVHADGGVGGEAQDGDEAAGVWPQAGGQGEEEEIHATDQEGSQQQAVEEHDREEEEEEEEGFRADGTEPLPDLAAHKSALARVLQSSPDVYERLRGSCTTSGVTLARCIKAGVDVEGHPFIRTPGIFAGDAESYVVFSEVFDPVLREWFPNYAPESSHPASNLSPADIVGFPIDPEHNDVAISVYLRLQRNLAGVAFTNAGTWEQRREVEAALQKALMSLGGDLKGEYLPLEGSHSMARFPEGMSEDDAACLAREKLLPEEPDSDVMVAAGFARHWPDARGVFRISEGLAAWVNEHSHVQLMCRRFDGDVRGAFSLIARLEAGLRSNLEAVGHTFAFDAHWGFLSPSLPQLGTGMTVGCVMQLPTLSSHYYEDFLSLCAKFGIKASWHGTADMGRHNSCSGRRLSLGQTWDLSIPSSLGVSEVDQANYFVAACRVLRDLEVQLRDGTDPTEALTRARQFAFSTYLVQDVAEVVAFGEGSPTIADAPAAIVELPSALPAGAAEPAATDAACVQAAFEPTSPPVETAFESTSPPGHAAEPAMTAVQSTKSAFELAPGVGDDDMDGFPVGECPEELPDLSRHFSMVAVTLRDNPDLYQRLRVFTTTAGVSLARCIKPGLDNQGHPMIKTVGLIAGDAECYEVFGELFTAVLRRIRGLPIDAAIPPARPRSDVVDCERVREEVFRLGPLAGRILSVSLQARRNLAAFRWPSATSKPERRQVEAVLVNALETLQDDASGEYFPLPGSNSFERKPKGMCAEDACRLEDAALMMHAPDAALVRSAGSGRQWPDGRGVFASPSGHCAAWVNDEDHLCLWSQSLDSDISAALRLLLEVDRAVESALGDAGHAYARSETLGFLTSDPSLLGTAMRAKVRVRLPFLSEQTGWKRILTQIGLSVVGAPGGNLWEISCSPSSIMRESEVGHVVLLLRRLNAVLDCEARLERGDFFDIQEIAETVMSGES